MTGEKILFILKMGVMRMFYTYTIIGKPTKTNRPLPKTWVELMKEVAALLKSGIQSKLSEVLVFVQISEGVEYWVYR